ncbi:unnamed protein product [Prorocentrum cordatum]|nr:unnamed protein product [Polarella glacialis]
MAFRPLFLAVLIASTRSANALEAETSAEASQSMATAGRTHGGKADLKVDPYFCDISNILWKPNAPEIHIVIGSMVAASRSLKLTPEKRCHKCRASAGEGHARRRLV